ncbi:MAG: radical SAM protein [Polyangiaceae bacterium]|nr:radical SAM protein [Polyangiaceae bacterium]
MSIERVSLELTRQCRKGCHFCYNGSNAAGATSWSVEEVVSFASDCARNGVKALSLGGGEPLEYEGIFEVLRALNGVVFRSMTTNGLLLDTHFETLANAKPEKVHVSVHYPSNMAEVERVIRQVTALEDAGIRSGINFLVRQSDVDAAKVAAAKVRAAGIENERVTYLPMRGEDTPTSKEIAAVAGGPFQSMSCLLACRKSERFCSVAADKSVAWCSYTRTRRLMNDATWRGLEEALRDLGLEFCGGDAILARSLRRTTNLPQ